MLLPVGLPSAFVVSPQMPDWHSELDEQRHCWPFTVLFGWQAPLPPWSSVQQPLAPGQSCEVVHDTAQPRLPAGSFTQVDPDEQQLAPQGDEQQLPAMHVSPFAQEPFGLLGLQGPGPVATHWPLMSQMEFAPQLPQLPPLPLGPQALPLHGSTVGQMQAL